MNTGIQDIPADLITLFWVVLMVFWLISAFSTKRYVRRNYASWLARFFIVVIVFTIYNEPGLREYFIATENSIPLWLQWVGVVICACGILFALWARVNLGRNWGMPMSLKQDPELVTSGPYAYVRHPIYSGFLLAAFGSCFVSVWWVAAFISLAIYFAFAARAEEKIMAGEFGQKYADYMKRSKMLIPFVF